MIKAELYVYRYLVILIVAIGVTRQFWSNVRDLYAHKNARDSGERMTDVFQWEVAKVPADDDRSRTFCLRTNETNCDRRKIWVADWDLVVLINWSVNN